MAYNFNFNACLKLSEEQGLQKNPKLGKKYHFTKNKERIYQLRVPTELYSDQWQAVGKVIIHELTIGRRKTEGVYEFVKLYTPEESKVISSAVVLPKEIREVIQS